MTIFHLILIALGGLFVLGFLGFLLFAIVDTLWGLLRILTGHDYQSNISDGPKVGQDPG